MALAQEKHILAQQCKMYREEFEQTEAKLKEANAERDPLYRKIRSYRNQLGAIEVRLRVICMN